MFLAGDAAHQNTPSGGFGLNTGMGDAVDLGWKLAGVIEGWGGPRLLEAYERERRPVAERIVKQATDNFMRDRGGRRIPRSPMDSAEGAAARREMGEAIIGSQTHGLSHRRHRARLRLRAVADRAAATARRRRRQSISDYRPTTRPGARAPHAWLPDGRSMLDLFGRGFVLLRLGGDAAGSPALEARSRAAACRSRSPRSPIPEI